MRGTGPPLELLDASRPDLVDANPGPRSTWSAATALVDLAGSPDGRVIHAALTSARPPGKRTKHHYSDQDDPPEHAPSTIRLPARTLLPAAHAG